MGQKRQQKLMRRRARMERQNKTRQKSSKPLHEQNVPGLEENGQPMRRALQAACVCGGDLVYVDASYDVLKSRTTAVETAYVYSWDRHCSRCGHVEHYRDVSVAPVFFATPKTGPLHCERCDTQLTSNPNEPPALDGHDWYCASCEFGGGEAMAPQCAETRVEDGYPEQCALDLGHDGEHGGPSGDEWVEPDDKCKAVTKTKDEYAVPIRCSGYSGHEDDHHAQGGYYMTTEDGETTHHKYELRWSTWSPAEERAKNGAPAPCSARR